MGERGLLPEWITRAELAQELEVTTGTLARWAFLGSGPSFVRVGRKVIYRREAVIEWLNSKERKANDNWN